MTTNVTNLRNSKMEADTEAAIRAMNVECTVVDGEYAIRLPGMPEHKWFHTRDALTAYERGCEMHENRDKILNAPPGAEDNLKILRGSVAYVTGDLAYVMKSAISVASNNPGFEGVATSVVIKAANGAPNLVFRMSVDVEKAPAPSTKTKG